MLKPSRTWNGKPDFEFIVKGLLDANYATDPSSRKSISGYSVFLEDAPISMKSGQQKSVTLSTAEAKLVSGTQCAQDMLFVMRVKCDPRLHPSVSSIITCLEVSNTSILVVVST
jgi:hypothetical protein